MARPRRMPPAYDAIARALLALPFLASGASRLLDARPFVEALSGAGLVFPDEINYVSAAVELAGALCLVLRVRVWVASTALYLYLLPFAFVLHGLPAQESAAHGLLLARDLAVAGGLVLLAGVHRHDRRAGFGAPRVPAP
ncbi:MAG: DoxX family protein [Gemmatimonadota bacterium]